MEILWLIAFMVNHTFTLIVMLHFYINSQLDDCNYYLLSDIIGVVQQVVRTQVAGANKKAFVNLTLADEWYIPLGSQFIVNFLWLHY